jgi:hypothetical protein
MAGRSTDMRAVGDRRRIIAAVLAVFLCLLAIALPGSAQTPEAKDSAVTARLAQVSGIVTVAGPPPMPKPLPVFKNRAYCGTTVPDRSMLINREGGLRNAVILLRPRGHKAPTVRGQAVLDNQSCAFAPRVQIVTPGTELLLKNSDPILHTVRARLGSETLFNVGLPRWRRVVKSLDRPGIVRIDCDVLHTWMSAAIFVADTPYYALSDAAGRFTIRDLMPGIYDVEIWHERLGSQKMQFAVTGAANPFIEVVYASK